jgi:hypothetical protein
VYASAQPLDFLATTKNPSFPIRKLTGCHQEFPDGNLLGSRQQQLAPNRQAIRGTGFVWQPACRLLNFFWLQVEPGSCPGKGQKKTDLLN